MKSIIYSLLGVSSLMCSSFTFAEDVQEWHGKDRDASYKTKAFQSENWSKIPQTMVTINGIGDGYASPIVVGDMIYVTGLGKGEHKQTEFLHAIGADHKIAWSIPYGPSTEKSYNHTRSTPTYKDGKIYLLSGAGVAVCIDVKTQKKVWERNMRHDFAGACGTWGFCESPLIVDDKMIVTIGGNQTSVVALNIKDGKDVWKTNSLKDLTSYVSPIYVTHNDIPMIITATTNYLLGVNPKDGAILWSVNFNNDYKVTKTRWDIMAQTPIYKDGRVALSTGYDWGTIQYEISQDGKKATLKWVNYDLDNQHGGIILKDKHCFGSSHDGGENGKWACIDWETGKTNYLTEWKGAGRGVSIAVNDYWVCYDQKRGEMGLATFDTQKLNIVSQFRLNGGSGPHWAHPIVANGKIIHRRGNALFIGTL